MIDIKKICDMFGIAGEYSGYNEIPNGNINKTYNCIYTNGGKETHYVLQKININVFPAPIEMMNNIDTVTSHIENKINESDLAGKRQVLRFIKTKSGEFCHVDDEGGYWRLCPFIEKSVTYNISNDPAVLFSTGKAFGEFQMQLSDFDASGLYEIIPDFHNTKKRLDNFFAVVEKDPCGRADKVLDEIKYFESVRKEASKLTEMLDNGEIPIRVTHNDTKCNNVLFDEATKEPLAVIDLDTVMPGLALHDYGDAVRFAANTAEEDEPDTSKIRLDEGKFAAFTKGFLSSAGSVLTDSEKDNLVDSIIVIAMELAGRFLDDYLTGDLYFKTDYPGHNLVRTRAQITLAKDIIARYDELNAMVKALL